jgi:hypothetical protein
MSDVLRRLRVAGSLGLVALACSGSPAGPGGAGANASVTVDGQTVQFANDRSANKGFRRPPHQFWPNGLLDITLASCTATSGAFVASLLPGNPTPGRYDLTATSLGSGGPLPTTGVLDASWTEPSGEVWRASATHGGSSGSITVTSASTTSISAFFSFRMVPHGSGPLFPGRPAPPTKLVEGTFDVQIDDRMRCD